MQEKNVSQVALTQKVCVCISTVTFPDLNLESICMYKPNSVNCLDRDIARVDSACLEHM